MDNGVLSWLFMFGYKGSNCQTIVGTLSYQHVLSFREMNATKLNKYYKARLEFVSYLEKEGCCVWEVKRLTFLYTSPHQHVE